MAKKVVATLKKEGGLKYAKIIKAVKNPTTGAYTFKEEIILQDDVNAVAVVVDIVQREVVKQQSCCFLASRFSQCLEF
jgi:hypothetical protein